MPRARAYISGTLEKFVAIKPPLPTQLAPPCPETCYKVQVAGRLPERGQPWGASKEGRPQSAPLWSLRVGVQGERESKLSPPEAFGGSKGGYFGPKVVPLFSALPLGRISGLSLALSKNDPPQGRSHKFECNHRSNGKSVFIGQVSINEETFRNTDLKRDVGRPLP